MHQSNHPGERGIFSSPRKTMITTKTLSLIFEAIIESLAYHFDGEILNIALENGQWVIEAVNDGPGMAPLRPGEEYDDTSRWLVSDFDLRNEEYVFEEVA